jgi:type II secretory pathway component GspD/PulD (secretin)
MNRIAGIFITLILCILFIGPAANAAMVRFVRAADGQTIVIDRNGTQIAVTLTGVEVQPEDQAAAKAFLEHELAGAWLLVENGNVYRSPDALFINAEMQKRGYINPGRPREIYFGEIDFEPRSNGAATTTAPPSRSGSKTYTRTSRRSSAPRRRGR